MAEQTFANQSLTLQEQLVVERLPLAGYPIHSMTANDAGDLVKARLTALKPTALLFANTNFILKCQNLRRWLNSEQVILLNDGIGLDIIAKILHGKPYEANLGGTDFLPYLFRNFLTDKKVFLIGGKPGVAEKSAIVFKHYGLNIAGCLDGYTEISIFDLHQKINQSGAEIVVVAMGNPLQEQWIHTHMHELDAKLFIGVGAFFDFISGSVPRAPQWIRRIRFEWLYRLYQEPRRLMRRYTLDILSFLYLCFEYSLKMKITNKS